MPPRGGVNMRDDQIKLFFLENLNCHAPSVRPVRLTSQTGPSSARGRALLRPLPCTGQASVAQSTCKNSFKLLLTSSMNETW
jgi:hypothetical protein